MIDFKYADSVYIFLILIYVHTNNPHVARKVSCKERAFGVVSAAEYGVRFYKRKYDPFSKLPRIIRVRPVTWYWYLKRAGTTSVPAAY